MSNAQLLSPLINLIDDDEAVRESLALLISTVGLRVQSWARPEDFMRDFDRSSIGAVVLDVRMPGISGLSVLEALIREGVDQPIIMLTGHGTVEMCRRAFKLGATLASVTTPTAKPASATGCCPSANAKCSA